MTKTNNLAFERLSAVCKQTWKQLPKNVRRALSPNPPILMVPGFLNSPRTVASFRRGKGWQCDKIFFSASWVERLTDSELAPVFLHELGHYAAWRYPHEPGLKAFLSTRDGEQAADDLAEWWGGFDMATVRKSILKKSTRDGQTWQRSQVDHE